MLGVAACLVWVAAEATCAGAGCCSGTLVAEPPLNRSKIVLRFWVAGADAVVWSAGVVAGVTGCATAGALCVWATLCCDGGTSTTGLEPRSVEFACLLAACLAVAFLAGAFFLAGGGGVVSLALGAGALI